MLGFYFPPHAGEKVTLEITILMALTFYMNQVKVCLCKWSILNMA